jgi:hypothetical protein
LRKGAKEVLKFISFILTTVSLMVCASESSLTAGANDAETHYFGGTEYYMHQQDYAASPQLSKALKLKPDYAGVENAFAIAYAKLEKGNSEEMRMKKRAFSLGYGCLGAYQGAIVGGTIGYFITLIRPPFEVHDEPRNIVIGALAGTAMGGFLGSQARTRGQKLAVIIGGCSVTVGTAIAATCGFMATYVFQ